MNPVEMVDLFYANKHLHDKIEAKEQKMMDKHYDEMYEEYMMEQEYNAMMEAHFAEEAEFWY